MKTTQRVAQIFRELKPLERAAVARVRGREITRRDRGIAWSRTTGVRVLLFRARRQLRDLLQARGILVNRRQSGSI